MSASNAVVSAPATTEENASWHGEVCKKVFSAGLGVRNAKVIAPDKVCFVIDLPEGAWSCCNITALTECDEKTFYVTVQKRV